MANLLVPVTDCVTTNSDGTERQVLISKLRAGEQVMIKRAQERHEDPLAIQIQNKDGHCLGYVQKTEAYLLAQLQGEGFEFYGKIRGVREFQNSTHLGFMIDITVCQSVLCR